MGTKREVSLHFLQFLKYVKVFKNAQKFNETSHYIMIADVIQAFHNTEKS